MNLPHLVTIRTPAAGTDAYGTANAGLDYAAGTTRTARAFVQPRNVNQFFDGVLRQAEQADWVMFTLDQAVTSTERVEWDGHVFDVTGVQPYDTPGAGRHHSTVEMREVTG